MLFSNRPKRNIKAKKTETSLNFNHEVREKQVGTLVLLSSLSTAVNSIPDPGRQVCVCRFKSGQ
ncbi:MAG: hypothetical protein A2277_05115 [Desulfobacterales bacterium RIFOXYA12_FULL_46_15]|nr:MAG: hypothetical protein A2277_05115 [Desulfobacterales bacterium RIFOXYA12_FULL_46_15]